MSTVMDDMMGGMWAMMALWIVLGVVLLALGTYAVIAITRRMAGPRKPDAGTLPDPAEQELRRAYGAGEIEREEYLQRKVDLEQGRSGQSDTG